MSRKIVVLEDTAVEFGIKTQEVIHRIEALEAAGRLTGVMDDRGKVCLKWEAVTVLRKGTWAVVPSTCTSLRTRCAAWQTSSFRVVAFPFANWLTSVIALSI